MPSFEDEEEVAWNPEAAGAQFGEHISRLIDHWQGDLGPLEQALLEGLEKLREKKTKAG